MCKSLYNKGEIRILGIMTISFIIGALALSCLGGIQRSFLGVNPFIIRGYYVPFFFGGVSGLIIGMLFYQVKKLNYQLTKRLNVLEGIIPICCYCKKIRKPGTDPDAPESWTNVENYLYDKFQADFSHGICPTCYNKNCDD